MSLHFSKIAITLNVKIPEQALEQHIAASPAIVSAELARQVVMYEHENHLGYFPALEYLLDQNAIDSDLIDALHAISWVATSMVRNEIQTRLRPVFSKIQIESIQTLGFTLPSIRPTQANVIHELINHYSSMIVKVNLIATLIQKSPDQENLEVLVRNLIYRWLKDQFDGIEITGISTLK